MLVPESCVQILRSIKSILSFLVIIVYCLTCFFAATISGRASTSTQSDRSKPAQLGPLKPVGLRYDRTVGHQDVRIIAGWDWWLPEGVKPVEYSGFVTSGKDRFSNMITVGRIAVKWGTVCPEPGVFNWEPLLDHIQQNKERGMRSGIHLRGVQRENVPDWIIEKYNVPVLDVIPLQDNQPWRIKIVPPWHPDVMSEYQKFLFEFGKTGIPQMEEVVYVYIHGVSPSRGEEMWMRAEDVEDWELRAGLTPEGLNECLLLRLKAFLTAFKGVEYKLVWLNKGPVGPKKHKRYRKITSGLFPFALSHGTGWRIGSIDQQHMHFKVPSVGVTLTSDGYCKVDDTLPIYTEHRFLGGENEAYGKGWEWRFGPQRQHAYRHRISTLRALQMLINFQYVSPTTLQLNPQLNSYALLTQGRLATNSPDAWAYLRECRVNGNTIKNLERWLIQRDLAGHRSVPAERVDRVKPLQTDLPGQAYDFDARRTDIKNGQKGLLFMIDKRFWNKSRPAIIKVTFIDHAKALWYLECTDADGDLMKMPVENSGDGIRKTATFNVPSLSTHAKFPKGMDFRIVTAGPGDVVVTMVRVIKPNWID